MRKKTVSEIMLLLLLMGMVTLSINVGLVKAAHYYNFIMTVKPESPTTCDRVSLTVSFDTASISYDVNFSSVSQVGNGFFVTIDIYTPQIVLPALGYGEETYDLGELSIDSYSFNVDVRVWNLKTGSQMEEASYDKTFTVTPCVNVTVIKVDPDTVSLGPEPVVGQEFTIDIVLEDVVDLYGWEVKLSWDNSLLNCTAEEYPILPPGLNWEAPNSLLLGPGIEQEFNATHGRWYHGLSALPMAPPMPEPFTGTIKLVTLTFEVLSRPSPNGTCILDLDDSKVSDSNAVSIDHEAINGYYEILATGFPRPELAIEPATCNTFTGGTFGIDVTISNVNASVRLVGVDIKVCFNATMLTATNATEGSFMKDPAWAVNEPPTYFFGPFFDHHYVGFGILRIPTDDWCEGGKWCLQFPEGSGTLATITFNATTVGSCTLVLCDTKLVDADGQPIDHRIRFEHPIVIVMEGAASPDVNRDGVVDIYDIVEAVLAFGSDPENPRWNPVADLKVDGVIDIYDLVLIALNFGTNT